MIYWKKLVIQNVILPLLEAQFEINKDSLTKNSQRVVLSVANLNNYGNS